MPVFDYICLVCQHVHEEYIYSIHERVLCKCGGETEKVWLPGSAPTVVDDSIPGGRVIENLNPQPHKYYSRSEIKRQMQVLGVVEKVEHKGTQDGDRSKHTQRWI